MSECEHRLATCVCHGRRENHCRVCGLETVRCRVPQRGFGWMHDTCTWRCAELLALCEERELIDKCLSFETEGFDVGKLICSKGRVLAQ